MSNEVEDVEITLAASDLRLRVSPYGASLRGLWRETSDGAQQDIVTSYTGLHGKVGGQGDVLIPFPGRIRDGRYTFEGQTYQMDCNDKEGHNAIHGFLRLVPWEIVEQSDREIMFAVLLGAGDHPGYPFSLRSTLAYTLDETGLTCRFAIENTGTSPAPVAAGFHPYFTVGSDHIDPDSLQVSMASILEFENMLPTGRVLPVDGTAYDFRQARPVGATKFNTCYLNPLRDADGLARIRLASPNGNRALTVWMDAAFDYVVLYSGDPLPDSHRRRSLAIEAMTCGSDAFNYHEWGLVTLQPGKTFAGSWGVATS